MTPKHILVAEDELHMQNTLSIILKKAGYRVSAAKDGYGALKIIRDSKEKAKPVVLLVTDIEMAGLTGIELISELDRLDFYFPIVVITGYESKNSIKMSKYKGSVEYIEKPFEAETLLEKVSQALEKKFNRKERLSLLQEG